MMKNRRRQTVRTVNRDRKTEEAVAAKQGQGTNRRGFENVASGRLARSGLTAGFAKAKKRVAGEKDVGFDLVLLNERTGAAIATFERNFRRSEMPLRRWRKFHLPEVEIGVGESDAVDVTERVFPKEVSAIRKVRTSSGENLLREWIPAPRRLRTRVRVSSEKMRPEVSVPRRTIGTSFGIRTLLRTPAICGHSKFNGAKGVIGGRQIRGNGGTGVPEGLNGRARRVPCEMNPAG